MLELAAHQSARAFAEYRRDLARAALLENLERQLLGNIVRDGRAPFACVSLSVGELFSWEGNVWFDAFTARFKQTLRRRCWPVRWTDSDLISVCETAMRGSDKLLAYLDYAVPRRVFHESLASFALWMRET